MCHGGLKIFQIKFSDGRWWPIQSDFIYAYKTHTHTLTRRHGRFVIYHRSTFNSTAVIYMYGIKNDLITQTCSLTPDLSYKDDLMSLLIRGHSLLCFSRKYHQYRPCLIKYKTVLKLFLLRITGH